jgi:hypothetical protein
MERGGGEGERMRGEAPEGDAGENAGRGKRAKYGETRGAVGDRVGELQVWKGEGEGDERRNF